MKFMGCALLITEWEYPSFGIKDTFSCIVGIVDQNEFGYITTSYNYLFMKRLRRRCEAKKRITVVFVFVFGFLFILGGFISSVRLMASLDQIRKSKLVNSLIDVVDKKETIHSNLNAILNRFNYIFLFISNGIIWQWQFESKCTYRINNHNNNNNCGWYCTLSHIPYGWLYFYFFLYHQTIHLPFQFGCHYCTPITSFLLVVEVMWVAQAAYTKGKFITIRFGDGAFSVIFYICTACAAMPCHSNFCHTEYIFCLHSLHMDANTKRI